MSMIRTLAGVQATFPLSVHSSGRYLVTPAGTPFLIKADAAWGIGTISLANIDTYIADRKARGYNTALIMACWKHSGINGGSTLNANGDAPFSGTALLPASVVSAFWSYMDSIVAKFAAAGMLVLLTPAYSGFGGAGTTEGWWDSLTSTTVASNWGAWIGARYAASANVIWVGGGDYTPAAGSEQNISESVNTGLVAGGAAQLQTYHASRNNSAFGVWGTAKSWLKLGDIYTDDTTIPSSAATEYARSGPFPFFLIEDYYVGHAGTTTASDSLVEKWQALLSGACGIVQGDESRWTFAAGYATTYSGDAEFGMQRLSDLCASYPWQTLTPVTSAALISSALGSGASAICPAKGTYSGGNFAFILAPTATSPTLVLSAFSQASVRVRSMDLKTGTLSALSGSPFANSGSTTLTHPGSNSMGTNAVLWVVD